MKIFEYLKIKKPNYKKSYLKKYELSHNKNLLEKITVINYSLHHDTYRLLRKFKTPQYNTYYVMRNKKGFNTMLFNINYDIVICDYNGKVIDVFDNVSPGFVSKHMPKAFSVYFMPVGSIKHNNIKVTSHLGILRLKSWY